MYSQDALAHLKKYPPETLDVRTLEILRETLEAERTYLARLTAGIEDKAARQDFATTFAGDVTEIEAAITIIDAVKK